MFTFLGFVAFVVAFALMRGMFARMRLVEVRVFGESPVPYAMKVAMENAAREASAAANVAARVAEAERAAAGRRAAAEREAAVAAANRERAEAERADHAWFAAAAAAEPVSRPVDPVRVPKPEAEPVRATAAPSAPAAPPAAAAPPRPKKTINWEMFAGGRLMNVAGAIALVVGFGLLLKYAVEQNWIDAHLRVIAGVVLGAGAIGAGALMHAKQKNWFVNGVFGLGIGIWYVSGYASFAGYHLVPEPAAYAFMTFVTIAAFAIALRYDSIAVALVGWAGGFLTPFIAGGAAISEVGLASYLVMLDAGLLAISLVRRRWFVLQPLALVASYAVAVIWYAQNAGTATATVSTIALASLWFVFFAAETIDVLREPGARPDLKVLASLVNLLVSGACLYTVLGDASIARETLLAIAVAGYTSTYAAVVRFASAHLRFRYLYAFSAAVLAALFMCERFGRLDLVTTFSLAGLAVAAVSRMRRARAPSARLAYEARAVSLGAIVAAALAALPFALGRDGHSIGWDAAAIAFATAFITLAASAFAIDRLWRRTPSDVAFGIGPRIVAVCAIALVEFPHVAWSAAGATFACDALALAVASGLLRKRGLAYGTRVEPAFVAAAFLAMGAASIAFAPVTLARDVASVAWIAIALALGTLLDDGTRFSKWASIGFRCAAFAGIAGLESMHAGSYALATIYAGTAIAVAAFDRATRTLAFNRATSSLPVRGIEPNAFAVASVFLGLAAATTLAQSDVFTTTAFHIATGSRDGSLLAFIVAAFAIDRLFTGSTSKAVWAGTVLRIVGLLALAACDTIHESGNALATTFALEAIALAGIDRALRSARTDYAPAAETLVSGVAFGIAGGTALLAGALFGGSSVYAGHTLAFGFGGIDLALGALAATALVYRRFATAHGSASAVALALRQGFVATLFAAVVVHLSGFEAAIGYALLAIGLSIAASRSSARDLQIDGALSLAVGLVALVDARFGSHSSAGFGIGSVVNESFVGFMTNALATIVASELYRRSTWGSDVAGRAGRIAGALIAVLGVTLDVVDAFERAAASYAVASPAHVRLENIEQLTISVGWIVASIAFVWIGIQLRIREFRLLAIGLFDLTILKAFFIDVYALDLGFRIVTFIVLGATLMGVSFIYGRVEKRLFGSDGSTGDGVAADANVTFADKS